MEKQINEQANKEIQDVIEKHIKKEFDSFSEWKDKIITEKNILKESNDNFIAELDELKKVLDSREETITSMRNELNSFIHSYNLKNI
jgi:thiamine kinase-like enzyme